MSYLNIFIYLVTDHHKLVLDSERSNECINLYLYLFIFYVRKNVSIFNSEL